jgi:hypothetical protein
MPKTHASDDLTQISPPSQAHLPPYNDLAQNFIALGLFRHELPHAISNINPYIGQTYQVEYHPRFIYSF